MGQWLPDELEDSYNSYVAGPADHLAGSTDEAIGRFSSDATKVANSEWSAGQRFTGYLRLATRHGLGPVGEQAEDIAFENEAGEFMGREDSTDLAGPSLGPDPESGQLFDLEWRDPRAEDDDPTHPDNRPEWFNWLTANPEKVAGFLLVAVSLYLLKPLLEIGANLTEA